jgi:putative transposase
MFRITTFQELMKGLPRSTFAQVVKKHNADKYCKRFGHWDQLIAMLYAQLSGTTGLRPLQTAFNSHEPHLYHLGTAPIKRSTLADANEKRADTVFSEVATWLMGQVSSQLRQESKEFMFLLDSPLHVLLESTSETPAWTRFSAANVNDVELAAEVPLRDGALYVFDKGYCDYNWWHSIGMAGARFVTRFKYNAGLKIVENRDIPTEDQGVVLHDEIVKFKRKYPSGGRVNKHFDQPLRRVTIVRPDKPTPLVLATNDFKASAAEIAQRYKERWAIELFFKWIKQHLKIKKFLGRTENAVRIQILTALISYFLVALYKQRHRLKQSMWDCLCLIRVALFHHFETDESPYRRRRRDAQYAAEMQGVLL